MSKVQKIKDKIGSKFYAAVATASTLMFSTEAAAQTSNSCTTATAGGVSTIICRIMGEFNSVADLVVNFFYLVGIILFGVGIWLFNKDQKQPGQDHAKKGAYSMMVGVGLILITFLINTFATSVKGSAVTDAEYKVGAKNI